MFSELMLVERITRYLDHVELSVRAPGVPHQSWIQRMTGVDDVKPKEGVQLRGLAFEVWGDAALQFQQPESLGRVVRVTIDEATAEEAALAYERLEAEHRVPSPSDIIQLLAAELGTD